jgi:hypothetical protein
MDLIRKLAICFLGIFFLSLIAGLKFGFLTEVPFGGLLTPKFSTLAQYSGFLAYCFFLFSLERRIEKLDLRKRKILFVFSFFFCLASGYEVIWSFHLWFSVYSTKGRNVSIDEIRQDILPLIMNESNYSLIDLSELQTKLWATVLFKPLPVSAHLLSKFFTGIFAVSVFTTIFLFKKAWK